MFIAGLPDVEKGILYAMTGLSPFSDKESYLGIPLCTSRIRTFQCLRLFEKITAKLTSWKCSNYSIAERLVIVKSIAISMCAYYARIFILPAKLISMINSALNHFLWHANPFSKKMIPIAFSHICCSYKKGGLRIINIKSWNFATQSARIDKLLRHDNNLWASWCRNYLIRDSHFWLITPPSDCSWFLRNILRGRDSFLPVVQRRMKDIGNISFWYDPWPAKIVILANVIDYETRVVSGINGNASVDRY